MSAPLVLASGSPRRAELLSRVGYEFDVVVPDADEARRPGERPAPYAARVARDKARGVWTARPAAIVVAADTVVAVDGTVLGKPADPVDAHRMLLAVSGRDHLVVTAVHVCAPDGTEHALTATARVHLAASDPETLAGYVATGEPLDKAGAYGIQGIGAALVDRVDGDPTTVIGLPLRRTLDVLRSLGRPPPALGA